MRRKPFIWSEWLEDLILLASPPDLVDESLTFLELSKLCHLSLHCVPVLNDENEFTSSLNLFSSRAISFNFWELSFPFSAALDSFQRSIKIFSSASDHGVLRIWRPFTTRLRNMASQGAKDTHLKWNTAKSLVQTSIKVATHSEVDTNNRSSSWNLPKSFRLFSCPHEKISGIVFT